MIDLNEGLTVLSLFDGMSCGMIALDRAGIKVKQYYASEIDKYAIQVSKANWPGIIHIGDVTKVWYCEGTLYTEFGAYQVGKIDLLIGGSPCQGFSFAGKQLNFEDPRSKLFFEFVRIYEEIKADNPEAKVFLENVVMKKEYQAVISEKLGLQPVLINSALVSAQNRKRLYWTNIPFQGQPADRGILLKHILEYKVDSKYEVDSKYGLSQKEIDYMNRPYVSGDNHWGHAHDTSNDKSGCLVANLARGVPYNVLIDRTKCIQAGLADDIKGHDIIRRIYSEEGKAPTLNAHGGGNTEPKVATAASYRKLTPVECERLQCVADNYTNHVSNSQRYRMLGNGWNVDTIVHLFEPLLYADIL